MGIRRPLGGLVRNLMSTSVPCRWQDDPLIAGLAPPRDLEPGPSGRGSAATPDLPATMMPGPAPLARP